MKTLIKQRPKRLLWLLATLTICVVTSCDDSKKMERRATAAESRSLQIRRERDQARRERDDARQEVAVLKKKLDAGPPLWKILTGIGIVIAVGASGGLAGLAFGSGLSKTSDSKERLHAGTD